MMGERSHRKLTLRNFMLNSFTSKCAGLHPSMISIFSHYAALSLITVHIMSLKIMSYHIILRRISIDEQRLVLAFEALDVDSKGKYAPCNALPS